MKTPRFIIAHNRLAKSVDLYIVHTRVPAFIARFLPEATTSELAFARVKRGGIVELVRQFEPAEPEAIQVHLGHMADWYNYAGRIAQATRHQ